MPRVNRGMRPMKKVKKGTMSRLLKYLFKSYRLPLLIVAICIIISAIAGSSSSIFLKNIVDDLIEPALQKTLSYDDFLAGIGKYAIIIISIYVLAVIASLIQGQIMAFVSQGFLRKIRIDLFNHMEDLPIRYFDTHTHGDIMSIYTNDVDAIRQLISQSIPQLFSAVFVIFALFIIMLTYSVWLTLVVVLAIVLMFIAVAKIGGGSAKYFVRQQKSLGKVEGFIEEMMNGQKVVKAFNYEEDAIKKFDHINEELCSEATKANTYANILMPILMNIGNVLYVLLAFVGGVLAAKGTPNLTLTGIHGAISIGVIVSFLPMSKSFSSNIATTSQQVNSIVMALAGAERIFELLDEEKEVDNGYVTLVNINTDESGNIEETTEHTNKWAWRHPHEDGTLTYTPLKGDIRFFDVDFGYTPDKIVLHDVTIYANPGEKIAFVGATGAGKTTITNLINRFYDLADGKIRYDGININKIKKADLRRSLGIVLQDTNLFTGTVMENIRYGRLDATDEEVIAAAKLANAHDFITRLPDGYNTMLKSDGANLSQGQRQLLSIARCAVANTPAMILDEATSSIDTRTELIVQKGTDELMKGRTVFVIAHRLSTIQNADVIMVLDHGRIIERGSHEKLMAEKGRYYQLYTGMFELD